MASMAHVPAGIRDPSQYSLELESLRGGAVLLVFFFHISGMAAPIGPDPGPLFSFIYAGHTGVTLFFVLSAFLLSRPFIVAARGGRAASWRLFWSRRALRILPLYACAVVIGTTLHAESAADLLHAVPYLLFLDAVPGVGVNLIPYSVVWWSLATEAQFYVVLPLAALCFQSRVGRLLGLVVLASWALAYTGYLLGEFPFWVSHNRIALLIDLGCSLFGRAPAFALGVLAAWAYDRYGRVVADWGARSSWVRFGAADALLFAVLLALGELLSRVYVMSYFKAELEWHQWHLLESLLWAAVVLLVVTLPLRTKVLFSNRLLGSVGLISYSVYMIHYPVLYKVLLPVSGVMIRMPVGWTQDVLLASALACAIVLVLSVVTYRVIELPVLRRKAKLGAHAEKPAD